jgi:hypothetical protein
MYLVVHSPKNWSFPLRDIFPVPLRLSTRAGIGPKTSSLPTPLHSSLGGNPSLSAGLIQYMRAHPAAVQFTSLSLVLSIAVPVPKPQ